MAAATVNKLEHPEVKMTYVKGKGKKKDASCPPGYHRMPGGKLMKDSAMKKGKR